MQPICITPATKNPLHFRSFSSSLTMFAVAETPSFLPVCITPSTKKSASLQEFFLLAHYVRCGGDSFSFEDFFVETME